MAVCDGGCNNVGGFCGSVNGGGISISCGDDNNNTSGGGDGDNGIDSSDDNDGGDDDGNDDSNKKCDHQMWEIYVFLKTKPNLQNLFSWF